MGARVLRIDQRMCDATPEQRMLASALKRVQRHERAMLMGLALSAMSGGLVGMLVGIYLCRVVWP